MAVVKYPFYSQFASGTLITNTTSPPRGRKRRQRNYRNPIKTAEDRHKGPMAGPLVYSKNGRVTAPR